MYRVRDSVTFNLLGADCYYSFSWVFMCFFSYFLLKYIILVH